MSNIAKTLLDAKLRGGGFVPFVTAGDPDLATTLLILEALAAAGADVIELGVPFSDPMADGPVIQRSSQRAIKAGTTLQSVIELAAEFKKRSLVPLVLFSYFNPIDRFGLERFKHEAENAGIEGLLLTDVVDEEAAAIADDLSTGGIDLISLIAPTTTDERLERICEKANGFIYAVSRTGVTGTQISTSESAKELVMRARRYTDLPIAVGFGISSRQQILDVWDYADAAVVGSAIVKQIENAADPLSEVEAFIRGLLPDLANKTGEN